MCQVKRFNCIYSNQLKARTFFIDLREYFSDLGSGVGGGGGQKKKL